MPKAKGTTGSTTTKVANSTGDAKHVLGIIVVSQIPLPLDLFKKLFPDIDWKTQCRILRKYCLLAGSDSQLTPSKSAMWK
jgi:hypothetical protein